MDLDQTCPTVGLAFLSMGGPHGQRAADKEGVRFIHES